MNDLSMMRQGDTEMLSEAIKQANASLLCGQECREEKKKKELKEKYEKLQKTIDNSDAELAEAQKNYFKYAFGEAAYNDVLKNKYVDKANSEIEKYKKDFNTKFKDIENLEKSCKEKEKTINYLIDLINKYKTTNKKNSDKIGKEVDSNNTAHRRVFYEEDKVKRMMLYNKIIYCVMWVTYVLFTILFIYFKLYKKTLNIVLFILFTLSVFRTFVIMFVRWFIVPLFL